MLQISKSINDAELIYTSLMAVSNVFANYGEFLEEINFMFFNLQAHEFALKMMEHPNSNKNFLFVLFKIFGSIANGSEIYVKVLNI